MKHLLIVTYSGDMQGTVLEKKLKDYVLGFFNNTLCSEDAAEDIVKEIRKTCDQLAASHPKCKKPEIEVHVPAYSGISYCVGIASDDPNKNNGLLVMKPARTLYVTKHETVYRAVDNNLTEI